MDARRNAERTASLRLVTIDAVDFKEAMERAGRMLALRARSEREVRDRLREAEFDDETIDAVVARLYELDLLNDEAFAVQLIEERATKKGLGPRMLLAELEAKGVDRATAEAALGIAGIDEETQAVDQALKLVRKVINRPIKQQAAKLQQMLVRRGFSYEAAAAGVKAVLPPEGWD
ncbi:MAG TPA: regulatory protein RecX [Actinomycetota bacterium]|nr:regulatory protein RecX [Actinomycetota bacterium]